MLNHEALMACLREPGQIKSRLMKAERLGIAQRGDQAPQLRGCRRFGNRVARHFDDRRVNKIGCASIRPKTQMRLDIRVAQLFQPVTDGRKGCKVAG